MQKAFGDAAPSIRTIRMWAGRFREGRTDLEDNPKSGRHHIPDLPTLVAEKLVEEPFASVRSISHDLDVSYGSVYNTLVYELQLSYYVTKWVPHVLTQQNKNKRVVYVKVMLEVIERRGIGSVLTGDESWIYHDNPHDGYWSNSQRDENCAVSRSIGAQKSMLTVFWGVHGFFLVEVMPRANSFNSIYACKLLHELDDNLKRFRDIGLKDVLFHWDNARAHTSILTQTKLKSLGADVLPHPPYSPDLAPCDFYLFGNLKRMLHGNKFQNEVELKRKVLEVLSSISFEERNRVFLEWIKRLTVISNSDGSYCFE